MHGEKYSWIQWNYHNIEKYHDVEFWSYHLKYPFSELGGIADCAGLLLVS